MKALPLAFLVVAAAMLAEATDVAQLTVTAVNPLPITHSSQTIELTARQPEPLGVKDLGSVHVIDAAGKELIVQAADTDGDAYRKADIVIFQSAFAGSETKTFTVKTGKKHEFSPAQFKPFGRFVRERFDDFAWENDRIAHRKQLPMLRKMISVATCDF